MITISNSGFYSAGVLAEVQKMAAEMAAEFPERVDPAALGGVWVAQGSGAWWEFPTGRFVVWEKGSSLLPICYHLSLEDGEVWLTGVLSGGHVSRSGEIPLPVSKRRLGRLSKSTATSAVFLFEFLGYEQEPVDPIVFFRDELVSVLEAEIARIRGLPED